MEVKQVNINDLKPSEYNPRRLTEKQAKHLEESIKKFGMVEPIIVNKHPGREQIVVGGHQRLNICKKLGWTEMPVIYVDLDEAKEKELNLRLNHNLGEFDWDLLANHFDEAMLEDVGFDELDKIFPKEIEEDEAPEASSEPPKSKLGEVYQLGRHRLMCGDATKMEDVEKLMGGKKADMVFTDPPYGVEYVSRVDKDRRKPWGNIENDDLKDEALREFLYDSLVTFKSIPMYVCCNWQSYPDFFLSLGKPNNVIVWDKETIGLGAGYRQQYELLCFYGVLNHNSETNVWQLKRDSSATYKHPTQKPVALSARAIKNSSKQDDIVLDLFGGSGSTLIAAEQIDRICYMAELDEKYCDVIRRRYWKFVNNGDETGWDEKTPVVT